MNNRIHFGENDPGNMPFLVQSAEYRKSSNRLTQTENNEIAMEESVQIFYNSHSIIFLKTY